MQIIELNQGTANWIAWRERGIGGSDAPVFWNGKHFGRGVEELWHRKKEAVTATSPDPAPIKDNSSMARGRKLEPEIRAWYENFTGIKLTTPCCAHDTIPWLKCSLDGLSSDHKLVAEIKAPRREDHETALDGEVPEKYMPQLDHLMLVTGTHLCHYVSHFPFLRDPLDQFVIVPYRRDDFRLNTLLRIETLFWESLSGDQPFTEMDRLNAFIREEECSA